MLDPERLARFEREAQVLASLNHPNIGGIHGLKESPSTSSGQAGIRALVLELTGHGSCFTKSRPRPRGTW